MNSWTTIGVVCLGIGVILAVAGIAQGSQAASAVDSLWGGFLGSYGEEVKERLFWEEATPYIVGSAIMIVVGIVGLAAGSQAGKKTISNAPLVQSSPKTQTQKCPSCGQDMIFSLERQQWYCPRDKFYLSFE